MRSVPDDARYELHQLRVGRSDQQYVDLLWQRRYPHGSASSKWKWPATRLVDAPSATVTRLRK